MHAALIGVWEMFDYPCGQRLAPALRKEVKRLRKEKELLAGITYFDTADSYARGQSEQLLGKGFQASGGKHGLFLATKISSRDGATVQATVERSLKNLQVDQVDLIHIHSLENEDDLARIEAKGGVLEALLKVREQKLTRFIGISSHDAPAAMKLAS